MPLLVVLYLQGSVCSTSNAQNPVFDTWVDGTHALIARAYRLVEEDGRVRYLQNEYSVPWKYLGQTLPVRITDEELIVYNLQIEAVARHVLFPAGQTGQKRCDPSHRPPRDVQQQMELLCERFAQWGETGRRFLEGLLAEVERCESALQDLSPEKLDEFDHNLFPSISVAQQL